MNRYGRERKHPRQREEHTQRHRHANPMAHPGVVSGGAFLLRGKDVHFGEREE